MLHLLHSKLIYLMLPVMCELSKVQYTLSCNMSQFTMIIMMISYQIMLIMPHERYVSTRAYRLLRYHVKFVHMHTSCLTYIIATAITKLI